MSDLIFKDEGEAFHVFATTDAGATALRENKDAIGPENIEGPANGWTERAWVPVGYGYEMMDHFATIGIKCEEG